MIAATVRRDGLSVVSLGSLKVDVITDLTPGLDLTLADAYDIARIEVRVGGTSGTFAAAALQHFDRVSVIAAVGDDSFTDLVAKNLRSLNVGARLQDTPGVPNGVVISIRSQDEHHRARRLLVASQESAHLHLSAQHVTTCADLIASADALVCDAYFLRSPIAATALSAALDIANQAKVPVVFDLVPHSLPASTQWPAIQPFVSRSQIVVAEARTVVGLCERRWPITERPDEHLAARAAAYARDLHHGTWLIRYGDANIGDVIKLNPDGTTATYPTGYTNDADRWGFGDRLLAREVHDELTATPRADLTTVRTR